MRMSKFTSYMKYFRLRNKCPLSGSKFHWVPGPPHEKREKCFTVGVVVIELE